MQKRTALLIIPFLVGLIFAIVPVICFAGTGWWPTSHSGNVNVGLGVTFWVIYGIDLLALVGWVIFNAFVKRETAITYLNCIYTLFLQLLAPITLLFFFGESTSWILVFPIVIAAIAYIIYGVVICLGGVYSKQVKEVMPKIQSEQAEVVNADKEFNNDDGSFKGSRVKVNKDK